MQYLKTGTKSIKCLSELFKAVQNEFKKNSMTFYSAQVTLLSLFIAKSCMQNIFPFTTGGNANRM